LQSKGLFGTLLSSAWLVSPRQALAGLAERMQLVIVWLLGSKEPSWCELLFVTCMDRQMGQIDAC